MAILWLSCVSTNSYAAIASGTILDVSINGGDDNNGGGYSAYSSAWLAWGRTGTGIGTDYSNQDLAAQTYSDLATTGVGSQITTSIGTMPTDATGNIIHIRDGANFIKGFYQVISIQTTGKFTVDRNCTTAAGSNGIGNLGGRWKTLWWPQNTATGPIVAGNTIYIANGTYYPIGASTYVLRARVNGGSGTPVSWIGYYLSRDDSPNGYNRPILDANGKTNAFTVGVVTEQIFKNTIFRYASTTCFDGTGSGFGPAYAYNCRATLSAGAGFGGTSAPFTIIDCEADNNSTQGFNVSGTTGSSSYYSIFHDNSSNGMQLLSIGVGNIYESNGATGCFYASGGRNSNCISYNNTGTISDGFASNAVNSSLPYIINCISINNGRYGFRRATFDQQYLFLFDYNCYFGNVGGGLNNIIAGSHDITSDPLFVNPSDFTLPDYTLKSGSPCIKAGMPMISSDGVVSIDYKWNIGVDQGDHQTLSAGSVQ